MTSSPEPLVQIQNNLTEMFLIMPSNDSAPLPSCFVYRLFQQFFSHVMMLNYHITFFQG